ncbi:MAG: heme lyase CcmF/NrfE family subunit, partial [Chloroflexi bacterium]|nr:heme lyase CcmF/NrfE family subunit [Chloroflexota bacterium]
MADLGAMALLLGLALSAYSVIGSAIGVKIGMPALIVSARRALYMTTLAAAVASAALINAFVQNDFSIKYVADHSNSVMERAFVWVAFYSGNEGSLLYIVLALGVMSALAIRFAPKRMAPSMPWTIAVLAAVQLFYFFVLSFFASPFELLETIPVDGRGIN